jgi:hypothetical protein
MREQRRSGFSVSRMGLSRDDAAEITLAERLSARFFTSLHNRSPSVLTVGGMARMILF